MALTQEEVDALPDDTEVIVAINGACRGKWRLNRGVRASLRRSREEGDQIDVILAPPTAEQLADALRELHDFANVSTDYSCRERSREAFKRASELLERMGK